MPLIRIQKDKGIKHVFIAGEGIADLASVELVAGERQVKMGTTGHEYLAAGVARGSANSGALVRVITDGIVSGVKIASGYTVAYGDRLTIATSGGVVPLDTITPAGAISGYITGNISGYVPGTGLASGIQVASGIISGYATLTQPAFASGSYAGAFNSGAFVGTAFYTGRVLGKALTSGGSGMAAIQMLVSLQ